MSAVPYIMSLVDGEATRSLPWDKDECLAHNPYVGSFGYDLEAAEAGQQQAKKRTKNLKKSASNPLILDEAKTNAYVGLFRHAPENLGFKARKDRPPRSKRILSQLDLARKVRDSSRRLARAELEDLPTVTFEDWSTESKGVRADPTCAICLEPFEAGDVLRELPCSHAFHRRCIDCWLLGTRSSRACCTDTCPVCKARVGHPAEDPMGLRELEAEEAAPAPTVASDVGESWAWVSTASLGAARGGDMPIPHWSFVRAGQALLARQESA